MSLTTESQSTSSSHQPPSSTTLSFVQRQIIAGAIGSITTTLILNPVGVIKVRTQAGHGRLLDVTRQVIRENGISGFWMGSGLGMLQSLPSTVLYMTSYENIKLSLMKIMEDKSYQNGILLGAIPGVSGAIARTLVVTALAPLELVRTRILAGIGTNRRSVSTVTINEPRGVLDYLKKIYLTEGGVSAFYRGLGSTILRDTPFSAIYWMTFESVKRRVYTPLLLHESEGMVKDAENATINFLSGSTSGTLAAIITHPFDVLKTQSQLASSGHSKNSTVSPASSTTDCARQVCRIMAECCCPCTSSVSERCSTASHSSSASPLRSPSDSSHLSLRRGMALILRTRGFAGLFSGLSMRLATIIPGSGIMITVYEFAKTFEIE